jgi:enamine deaminase RidA (YjgF/YER057c/UK114 family)
MLQKTYLSTDADTMGHAMADEESIVETIKDEIAEAAKAVIAEIKSIATEVTDAVESTATLCDEDATPKDEAKAAGSRSAMVLAKARSRSSRPARCRVQVAAVTAADTLSGVAPHSPAIDVSSDEPGAASDIVITGGIVQLRATRLGSGNGRVYTIVSVASDVAGNTTTDTATCTVPHDRGK